MQISRFAGVSRIGTSEETRHQPGTSTRSDGPSCRTASLPKTHGPLCSSQQQPPNAARAPASFAQRQVRIIRRNVPPPRGRLRQRYVFAGKFILAGGTGQMPRRLIECAILPLDQMGWRSFPRLACIGPIAFLTLLRHAASRLLWTDSTSRLHSACVRSSRKPPDVGGAAVASDRVRRSRMFEGGAVWLTERMPCQFSNAS